MAGCGIMTIWVGPRTLGTFLSLEVFLRAGCGELAVVLTCRCLPGKSYTMIGKDSSPQSLGIVPCAISWLFRLIDERKERLGTRFSIRVSAVEVCGHDQSLRDLLAEVASGSLQDTQSPGVYLREDPVCGTQVRQCFQPFWNYGGGRGSTLLGLKPLNTCVLHLFSHSSRTRMSCGHPQQRKQPSTWMRPWQPAALVMPAAGRTPGAAPTCSSRCMCTSIVWRSVAKEEVGAQCYGALPGSCQPTEGSLWASLPAWVGAQTSALLVLFSVSGGRSRLHLIDLGSCETALSRGGEASGGPLCLSLSALGSVILALVNGAKHVPYR